MEVVDRVDVVLFFFFKQKTAYESSRSDRRSGVCSSWFFTVVTVVISAVLVVWLSRLSRSQLWLGLGLGLILGGGLGNLWDRLALGYVVDFVSLHYRTWYWPAFNVADSAISVGAALLIIDSVYPRNVTLEQNKGGADE